MTKILTGLGVAVNKHMLIRRLLLLWSVIIISLVTYIVFTEPPTIPTGTATAYGITVGLLATVIGLYKWGRERDAQREHTDGSGRGS